MTILKVQVNGPLPKRGGGANRSTRRTPPTPPPPPLLPPPPPPDNQPENRYDIIIRGEDSPHQPGIEPSSPSNAGDKFAWSERAGVQVNPLNYWLPVSNPFELTPIEANRVKQRLLKKIYKNGSFSAECVCIIIESYCLGLATKWKLN